ncbi:hypothetical protein [Streptomyces sp. DH8]|uniref:hypothetical protein n=1 Tax=Streptomyces sp. DH8 TaxID=2857008 RepID=UPI001E41A868|nr:hypothetical protein [Streptomyces sp. DH8]
MVIEEDLVRELLDAADEDSAPVLLEERARVAGGSDLDGHGLRGAAAMPTRAELMERLGASCPAPQDVALMVSSLDDAVGRLGS